jgi:hypothetical protein
MENFSNYRFVNSDAIECIAYDVPSATLRVIFTSGAGYDYLRVPPRVYRGLALAQSVGGFYNRQVKPKYRCQEVPARELNKFAISIARQTQSDALLLSFRTGQAL